MWHNQSIGKFRPFHYEVMWERHAEFQTLIEEAWDSSHAGSVGELKNKLQQLASRLVGEHLAVMYVRSYAELREDQGRACATHKEIKIEQRLVELRLGEEM